MVLPPRLSFATLLLDFDGTLANTGGAIVEAMTRTIAGTGRTPPPPEVILARIGLPLARTLADQMPDLGAEAIEELVLTYREHYHQTELLHAALYPDVVETLRLAREAGLFIAVVSNKGERPLLGAVERFGLAPLTNLVRGEDGSTPGKPHPDFYFQRIRPHLPKGPCLMVGDSWPDMAFARAIGAQACFASYGFGDEERCLQYAPEHRIDGFAELAAVLDIAPGPWEQA